MSPWKSNLHNWSLSHCSSRWVKRWVSLLNVKKDYSSGRERERSALHFVQLQFRSSWVRGFSLDDNLISDWHRLICKISSCLRSVRVSMLKGGITCIDGLRGGDLTGLCKKLKLSRSCRFFCWKVEFHRVVKSANPLQLWHISNRQFEIKFNISTNNFFSSFKSSLRIPHTWCV